MAGLDIARADHLSQLDDVFDGGRIAAAELQNYIHKLLKTELLRSVFKDHISKINKSNHIHPHILQALDSIPIFKDRSGRTSTRRAPSYCIILSALSPVTGCNPRFVRLRCGLPSFQSLYATLSRGASALHQMLEGKR